MCHFSIVLGFCSLDKIIFAKSAPFPDVLIIYHYFFKQKNQCLG